MAKFIITIEGEQAYIDAGLDSFSRANGYKESEEEGALTMIQVAEAALKRYFRETVSAYNANQAAEAARSAAIAQSSAALDETTLVISLEPTVIVVEEPVVVESPVAIEEPVVVPE